MIAEHEEIVVAALAKLGLATTERLAWEQVEVSAGIAERICDAIVAEVDQVLFFENGATSLRVTRPLWLNFFKLSIAYHLGLIAEEATDKDVKDLKSIYQRTMSDYLSTDSKQRKVRLSAAVCRAVEAERALPAPQHGFAAFTAEPLTSVNSGAAERDLPAADSEVTTEAPAPSKPSWNYLPVPEGLDPHTEFAVASASGVGGLRLIGARARGKKHKHEGTNCDDWFEFDSVGAWNLIAVSDGAGSKKYSRVGAKSACEAAIRLLRKELADVKITIPSKTTLDVFFEREPDWTFRTNSIEHVQKHLHLAMQAAHGAVEGAYKERLSGQKAELYNKTLERDLELADLSCTLLLAVQTAFIFEGQEYSFILACQVGDGMTAAIYNTAGGMAAAVLGSADSGEFSGETEFLTSKGKVELQNLQLKTQSLICRLNALMVMTDGVADDYFPNGAEAPRLFADLVLNGVLGSSKNANLSSEDRGLIAQAKKGAEYVDLVQTVEEVPKEVSIASAKKLSEALGSTAVLSKPDVLAELAIPISGASAEDRLRQWIDTYQVRGSFDDRTLVVLHRDGPN